MVCAQLEVFQLQTLTSTTGFVMDAFLIFNHPPGAADVVIFQDPLIYKQIGPPTPITWTTAPGGVSGNLWTFTIPNTPALAPYIGLPTGQLPVVGNPNWASPNVIVRNICSHDNHGRVQMLQKNGLVENNILANSFYGPLGGQNGNAQPTFGPVGVDGPGPTNQIWRGNKIVGTNSGNTDLLSIWLPTIRDGGYRQTGWMAAAIFLTATGNDGFYAPGFTNKSFQIYDNFIPTRPAPASR